MLYKYYPKPLKNSQVESPFVLGLCYHVGIGTSINLNEAMKHYEYSIKTNQTDAMLFASTILSDQQNDLYNIKKAINLIKKSIRLGDYEGYRFLADLYFNQNNKTNYKNALKYYLMYLDTTKFYDNYVDEVESKINIIKSQLGIV